MRQVLIVDDSLTVRMDLDQAFTAAGWQTTLCETVAAARAALAQRRCDLIVLDVLLPDGNGIEVLQQLKSRPETAAVPVMLLSTEAEVADQVRGLPAGADDYVGKPYDRNYVVWQAQRLATGKGTSDESSLAVPATDDRETFGRTKILAVDDSLTYLHALAEQLRHDNYEVVLARSGHEALDLLQVRLVDCILLDLLMPGMSGKETCERIKASPDWRTIPVVMLTAREDGEAVIESFSAGADDFVPKSSDFAVLRVRLRAQLRRRHFEEENRRIREQLHQQEIEIAEGRAARQLSETRASLLADLERKNVQLIQTQQAAEAANRAKDRFLAVLSHELRTPLTPVVMGVAMLQDRPDLDPAIRDTLEMVRRNVEMEARLIDDLLDVSRIAQGKIELQKQRVELCTVIRQAVEVCKPDIEARHLEFGVDLGPAAPYWVEADVPRLQQIFWNLLKNAVKFTPYGGCVGIRCRPNEKCVIAEVNDSGIGIETEALSRIFNAFEQAERSITQRFGGLGLGLAISKALVEMHGGTIEVHSEGRDKGATFRIQLPLAAPAPPSDVHARAAPQRAVRPLHILLVEDHGVTAKIMEMVLSAEGHTMEAAGDVATALELASQKDFDLLMSDLGLPDGSGHDLIRQLRQRGHHFPGIALSGYGQEEDIRRSYQAGFSVHLTKPASREAVIEAVASVMAGQGSPDN